jgi:hypothetical protein
VYSRIITAVERAKIRAYLKADGERDAMIRMFVSRARRYRPQIEADLRLLGDMVSRYERQVHRAEEPSSRSR